MRAGSDDCPTHVHSGLKRLNMRMEGRRVPLIGRPADALLNWLARAKITTGAVFRRIDRWGTLESTALSPQAVNLILKKRARLAGLDAVELRACLSEEFQ